MYEIISNLYLSSYIEAEIHTPCSAYTINCTKNYPLLTMNSIRIAVNDDNKPESFDVLYRALDSAVRFIDSALRLHKVVVVHCHAGQQRSAAVICAYLMAYHSMTKTNAVAYIKSKKRDAFLGNINFDMSLILFKKRICRNDIPINTKKDNNIEYIKQHKGCFIN